MCPARAIRSLRLSRWRLPPGASPLEAAIISNHAAGIVVGKIGTATVAPDELLRVFAI